SNKDALVIKEAIEGLPRLPFPSPRNESLSRAAKFKSEYLGKYSTFHVSGGSVGDLTSDAFGHYLSSVSDFETDEMIPSYEFRFILPKGIAKAFYEKMTDANHYLKHFALSCVPQLYKNKYCFCRALKLTIYDGIGSVISSLETNLTDDFAQKNRVEQMELLNIFFGKTYTP
ncbi:MAG: hypothetical protein RLZ92_1847, partial [Pseudomonadota bacterium]